MKKKLLLVLLALALVLTACSNGDGGSETSSGQGSSEGSGDVVKLGGIIPQTGGVSNYGNSTENGIKMAIAEVNEAGGINGKTVEWISYDDKGEVTDAVTAYTKLLEDGVNAIIGSITSKPSLAIAEAAVSDGIPIVTPTGTQFNITEGKDNVFRVCFTDPYQGNLLAIFANETLNAKTAALLRNSSSDYSMGITDAFVDKANELGIEIVADESYGDNDNDFKAQLTNIAGKNPDILLITDYYEKIALIAPQARQVGIEATFLGADGWDGTIVAMDASSHADIENSYFTNHFSLDDTSEKVKAFVEKYRDEYGEDPTAFSALGYDAVYMYKQAMETAGSEEYDDVVEAIDSISFEGVTGSFTFDENNNPVKSATMIRIEGGEYKFDSIVNPD